MISACLIFLCRAVQFNGAIRLGKVRRQGQAGIGAVRIASSLRSVFAVEEGQLPPSLRTPGLPLETLRYGVALSFFRSAYAGGEYHFASVSLFKHWVVAGAHLPMIWTHPAHSLLLETAQDITFLPVECIGRNGFILHHPDTNAAANRVFVAFASPVRSVRAFADCGDSDGDSDSD
jgi:hypothetical protein